MFFLNCAAPYQTRVSQLDCIYPSGQTQNQRVKNRLKINIYIVKEHHNRELIMIRQSKDEFVFATPIVQEIEEPVE